MLFIRLYRQHRQLHRHRHHSCVVIIDPQKNPQSVEVAYRLVSYLYKFVIGKINQKQAEIRRLGTHVKLYRQLTYHIAHMILNIKIPSNT